VRRGASSAKSFAISAAVGSQRFHHHFEVGVDQIAKPGERVGNLKTLCRVHASDSTQTKAAIVRLKTAFEIS